MSIESIVGERIANVGTEISPKHNSIFTAIDDYGRQAGVVTTAIIGLAAGVSTNINRYRNIMLPTAKDLASMVSDKSTSAPVSLADKVVIQTTQYWDGVTILGETEILDTEIRGAYRDIPSDPLIVEYDKETVIENMSLGNNRVSTHIQELLLEQDDDFLEQLHNNIFNNVSSNNGYLQSLPHDPVANYTELFLGLVITLGYISGTIGVTNIPVESARSKYLYALRNMLITALAAYKDTYDEYLNQEILIAKSSTTSDGVTTMRLVSEVYGKYLDDHNIDPIIGCGLLHSDLTRVRLEDFLKELDANQTHYDAAMRIASIKATTDRINVLRLAYKLSTREYFNNLTEQTLADLDYDRESIPEVMVLVEEYINSLETDKLLDITDVSRHIVAYYIHADAEFLVFVDRMKYYAKVFPKLTVDEVATCAMIAHTIDVVSVQFDTITK